MEQGETKRDLQARVWNLLNKGDIFRKVAVHPAVMAVGERMLGRDFQVIDRFNLFKNFKGLKWFSFKIGSIASNTIFPGGPGQNPHLDYPYWDMFR